jgi:hypothetical protein
MSYNAAYREDEQSTMSNVILEYTRTVANQIRETFLSGAQPPPPPPPPTPPPPPLSLLKTQKLQVEPANYGALDAILSGVLQTTATFKINITDLNNVIRMIFINGSSASGVARRVVLFIFGFNGNSINFVFTSQYNQRSFQSSLFTINRNEMLSFGYKIETDGALRVFINGTRINGGNFTEQNAPLAPIDSVQAFDVITNLECTLGDIAYYDVAKTDAFLEDIENYNINPTEPNLILGWREGTLIDVVNGIPMVIV